MAAGGGYDLALKGDGTLEIWGNFGWDSVNGELAAYLPKGGNSNFVAIATRAAHCLALRADGTVVAWGGDSGGDTVVLPGWRTSWRSLR